MMPPDYDDLDIWQALCEWLERQARQAAYPPDVPDPFTHLTYIGGNSDADAARKVRYRYGLIFYESGWGWRLHADWRDRLARLRQAQLEQREQRGLAQEPAGQQRLFEELPAGDTE